MRRIAHVVAAVMLCSVLPARADFVVDDSGYSRLSPNHMNISWLESKLSQTLGFGSLKMASVYVGQTLSESFEIRNRTRETLSYSLSLELADCENKSSWAEGDRLAARIERQSLTLRPNTKAAVRVAVTPQANHSALAFFHINVTPSKGKKEFISLNLFQFDTPASMTFPKNGFRKTLTEALRDRTKLGRQIRQGDKTYIVYENFTLACFSSLGGSLLWQYTSKTPISNLLFNGNTLFVSNCAVVNPATGEPYPMRSEYQSITTRESYDFRLNFEAFDKVWYEVSHFSRDHANGSKSFFHLKSLLSSQKLLTMPFGHGQPYRFPEAPDRLFLTRADESPAATQSYLHAIDLSTGKLASTIQATHFAFRQNKGLALCVWIDERGDYCGFEGSVTRFQILDLATSKLQFEVNGSVAIRVLESASAIWFSDFKHTGAYDLSARKLLWRQYGDGAILADPLLSPDEKHVYILEDDSKWNSACRQVQIPFAIRLIKFEARTGRQIWKATVMANELGLDSLVGSECVLSNNGDRVVVSLDSGRLLFKIKASDGKFAK